VVEIHFLALSSYTLILSSAWLAALQEVSLTSFKGDNENDGDNDDNAVVEG
jgi:hypothetical protein